MSVSGIGSGGVWDSRGRTKYHTSFAAFLYALGALTVGGQTTTDGAGEILGPTPHAVAVTTAGSAGVDESGVG